MSNIIANAMACRAKWGEPKSLVMSHSARALSPAAEAKNAPRGRGRFAAITMISPMQYRQAWKRDQERMTVIYALFLSVSGHTTHRGEETRQKNVQQTRLGVTKCRFVSAALLANCLSLAR